MRLIDADTLKEKIPATHVDAFENCRNCVLLDEYQVRRIIDEAPTVDAVEVVRCKDCIYFDDDVYMYCLNHKGMVMTRKDTYCSWGERKMEEP